MLPKPVPPELCDSERNRKKLRIRSVPGSRFPLQVIQANGLPEIQLTMFANEMLTMLSERSAYVYLRETVLFADWAGRDGTACPMLTNGESMVSLAKFATSFTSI